MEHIKDSNKYPLTMRIQILKGYISRNCPCIVFFHDRDDVKSNKLLNNIEYTCKKFPRVFCYKVGWKISQKNEYTFENSDLYDVSIWKENRRIKFFTNPTLVELDLLFSIVHRRLFGEYHQIYLSILKRQYKRRLDYNNQSSTKSIKLQNKDGENLSVSEYSMNKLPIISKIQRNKSSKKIKKTTLNKTTSSKNPSRVNNSQCYDSKTKDSHNENYKRYKIFPNKKSIIKYNNTQSDELVVAETLLSLNNGYYSNIPRENYDIIPNKKTKHNNSLKN